MQIRNRKASLLLILCIDLDSVYYRLYEQLRRTILNHDYCVPIRKVLRRARAESQTLDHPFHIVWSLRTISSAMSERNLILLSRKLSVAGSRHSLHSSRIHWNGRNGHGRECVGGIATASITGEAPVSRCGALAHQPFRWWECYFEASGPGRWASREVQCRHVASATYNRDQDHLRWSGGYLHSSSYAALQFERRLVLPTMDSLNARSSDSKSWFGRATMCPARDWRCSHQERHRCSGKLRHAKAPHRAPRTDIYRRRQTAGESRHHSIQPVHSDPAILRAWPKLLGAARCKRAFAYKDFLDGDVVLALGSDALTAPYAPLSNLYCTTARQSAKEPKSLGTINEQYALPLATAKYGGGYGRRGILMLCWCVDWEIEGWTQGLFRRSWYELDLGRLAESTGVPDLVWGKESLWLRWWRALVDLGLGSVATWTKSPSRYSTRNLLGFQLFSISPTLLFTLIIPEYILCYCCAVSPSHSINRPQKLDCRLSNGSMAGREKSVAKTPAEIPR